MYKNCLYCTTIFAIDSMFDSTLCNRRGHDLQTHMRFVRETRTDHVKRSMSPLHFWEQHELHAYFKDLTCEVMFRNDPVLTCLNIFQFPLVTCLRYWIRWCPEKLRRRFQQKKQHRTFPLQAEPERSTRLRRAGKALQALRQSKQGEPALWARWNVDLGRCENPILAGESSLWNCAKHLVLIYTVPSGYLT